MIRSFRDNGTEKIFNRSISSKLPFEIQQVALRRLRILNRSISSKDLQIPSGNRLEKLKGDREGQYSIRINERWRICFKWSGSDAFNVEIVDYH